MYIQIYTEQRRLDLLEKAVRGKIKAMSGKLEVVRTFKVRLSYPSKANVHSLGPFTRVIWPHLL